MDTKSETIINTEGDTETPTDKLDDHDDDAPLLSLADWPELDDALMQRLVYDLAVGFHSPQALALRYGLETVAKLTDYLREHPALVQEAQKMRAIFMSDATLEERVRLKFLKATEHLIPPLTAIAHSPKTPLAARIEAFKQLQRGSGMDGMGGGRASAKDIRESGHPFQINIRFTGAPPVTISAVDNTVDHELAEARIDNPPALPAPEEDDTTVVPDDVDI